MTDERSWECLRVCQACDQKYFTQAALRVACPLQCVTSEFAYGVLPMLAEQTSTQLSVSLTSGLVAGVCAAIVSQPGETLHWFCEVD